MDGGKSSDDLELAEGAKIKELLLATKPVPPRQKQKEGIVNVANVKIWEIICLLQFSFGVFCETETFDGSGLL